MYKEFIPSSIDSLAIFYGAMLFLVEIPGSPKIFFHQDHLYTMILNSLDQRALSFFNLR